MDSVGINMVEKADISVEAMTVCEGAQAQLLAEGFADSYEWMPSDELSDLEISNPFARPENTTNYTVIGRVSTCQPDTAIASVTVIPAPEFRGPDRIYFFPGQTLEINGGLPTVDGLYTYAWKPSHGLSCNDCLYPTVSPDTSMVYDIFYTDQVTGCISMRQIHLDLLNFCPDDLVNVPTAFSPDGDGMNDLLQLFPSSAIREIEMFRVYNRWGAVVFQTNDINEYWDGTLNGKVQPNGVYIYSLEYPCEVDGRMIRKAGDVTLIR